MNQNCKDVFHIYELPFKTYFAKKIEHLNQAHDETELIWVMRGNVTIICDGIVYKMTSQTLFMVNAFQTHSVISTDDAMIISFRFSKDHLEVNKSSFKEMKFINRIYYFDELVSKYREVPLLISQLLELLISPGSSHLIRYKIIGYYNMLIYELYTLLLKGKYLDIKQKNCKECLRRLNIVIDFISNNFLNKVSLEEIAQIIGISKYRLSHFIKDNLGFSFRELLTNMRFEYALKMLRDSNEKVVEVAKLSGFSDVKYLNQLVKNRFEMTALKYRKMLSINVKNNDLDELNIDMFLQELKMCLRNTQNKILQEK